MMEKSMVEYRCPVGTLNNYWCRKIEQASHGTITAERLAEGFCDYSLFDHSLEYLAGSVYEGGKRRRTKFDIVADFKGCHKITHIYYLRKDLTGYIVFVSYPDIKSAKLNAADIVLSALGVL